jgi:hypothetical protein
VPRHPDGAVTGETVASAGETFAGAGVRCTADCGPLEARVGDAAARAGALRLGLFGWAASPLGLFGWAASPLVAPEVSAWAVAAWPRATAEQMPSAATASAVMRRSSKA